LKNNYRSIAITTLVLTALALVTATATVAPVLGDNVALSGFTVTPAQAAKGASVTGSVTVLNLDRSNSVTVTVTFYDGGAPVATTSPTVIGKGDSQSFQLTFNTVGAGPHCYEATAGQAITGYCEAGGHLLGGISVPNFALMATTLSLTAVGTAGLLLALLRRRTI
jgi:hypothetical protein